MRKVNNLIFKWKDYLRTIIPFCSGIFKINLFYKSYCSTSEISNLSTDYIHIFNLLNCCKGRRFRKKNLPRLYQLG